MLDRMVKFYKDKERPWEKKDLFSLNQISGPDEEPLKLQEEVLPSDGMPREGVKNFLRVADDYDDNLIKNLITAARIECENYTWRSIGTQEWEMTLDKFPEKDYIEIPLPPLQSVDEITYKTKDATEEVFQDYEVDTKSTPGKVFLRPDKEWPNNLYPYGAVTITFTAGYEQTPEPIKQGILMLIAHWYENREAVTVGSIVNEMPHAVDALWGKYRVVRYS